ncbi:MAG: hypothetical protein ACQ9MH_12505 [Nitrospinales bacterium]
MKQNINKAQASDPVRIINEYCKPLPINIEKFIRRLLEELPEEDLVGLDAIIIKDKFSYNIHNNASEIYRKKTKSEPARIEISLTTLLIGHVYKFCLIPLFGKYLIARSLFQEIGNHYIHCHNEVPKGEWKSFKVEYSKKYAKKSLFFSIYYINYFLKVINVDVSKYRSKNATKKNNEY